MCVHASFKKESEEVQLRGTQNPPETKLWLWNLLELQTSCVCFCIMFFFAGPQIDNYGLF